MEKFITALEGQLAEKNVAIEMADEARAYLAREGYDPAMGARPLGRIIQEKVKRPLADEILFGSLEHGGTVIINYVNEALVFDYKPAPKPPPSQETPLVEEMVE